MAPEERRQVVLRYMADHGQAMKPKAVYRNLKYHHRITFGDETVKTILKELAERGLLRRVDPYALEEGELKDAGDKRAAYIITQEGRAEAQS